MPAPSTLITNGPVIGIEIGTFTVQSATVTATVQYDQNATISATPGVQIQVFRGTTSVSGPFPMQGPQNGITSGGIRVEEYTLNVPGPFQQGQVHRFVVTAEVRQPTTTSCVMKMLLQ